MNNKKLELREKNIIIAQHEYIPVGPGYDILNFLLNNSVRKILLITHPLKDFHKIISRYDYYENGKFIRNKTGYHWKFPAPFLYIKDIIYTIFWVYSFHVQFDLFVGLDPLNSFAGILLRVSGKCKKVAYYSIDYYAKRFENPILNKIYHSMDKFCVRFADETWNVSSVMAESRKSYNAIFGKKFSRQYTVPIAIHFDEKRLKPFEKVDKKKLMFTGWLVPLMGVDLILKSMPELIKIHPGIKLEVIGGGPEEKPLRSMAQDLHITKHVKFYGWVKNRQDLERILSDGAVGLATFNPALVDDIMKNADPAKVKDYMQAGMPVIATNVFRTSKDIIKHKCGIVIRYDKKEFIKAVTELLKNEKRLQLYRKNASLFVKQFDYSYIIFLYSYNK